MRLLTTTVTVAAPTDRIEGLLLGLAIGDALGNTTEGLLPGDAVAVTARSSTTCRTAGPTIARSDSRPTIPSSHSGPSSTFSTTAGFSRIGCRRRSPTAGEYLASGKR